MMMISTSQPHTHTHTYVSAHTAHKIHKRTRVRFMRSCAVSSRDWSECQCRKIILIFPSIGYFDMVKLIRAFIFLSCMWLSGFVFYRKYMLIVVAQKTKTGSNGKIVTILLFNFQRMNSFPYMCCWYTRMVWMWKQTNLIECVCCVRVQVHVIAIDVFSLRSVAAN